MASQINLENIRLASHPSARNAAVSTRRIQAGTTIVSVPALSTVLLAKEKGIRCDACHRIQSARSTFTLRKCSGCSSYWYCGEICQKNQWRSHHKQICKSYNNYVSSPYFKMLPEDGKLDALLLTHLVAETSSKPQPEDPSSPYSVFLSLIPRPRGGPKAPLICPVATVPSLASDHLDDLYDRFDNNNYVIHSHLTPFAHGIFPWASRLFNHSCSPNAVAKYMIISCQSIRMEVISLREIIEGEEITIPYTDPAVSFPQRQHHLEVNYGFRCQCEFCQVQQKMSIPRLSSPTKPEDMAALEAQLQAFVFGSETDQTFRLPEKPLYNDLPEELHCILHDSFLTRLSETFSNASNDGPYDLALYTGRSIFAVYLCIYPPMYPLIGTHALEVAKTFWNAFISTPLADSATGDLLTSAKLYLSISNQVLRSFGPEGDPGGPLDEISALQSLISEEQEPGAS